MEVQASPILTLQTGTVFCVEVRTIQISSRKVTATSQIASGGLVRALEMENEIIQFNFAVTFLFQLKAVHPDRTVYMEVDETVN